MIKDEPPPLRLVVAIDATEHGNMEVNYIPITYMGSVDDFIDELEWGLMDALTSDKCVSIVEAGGFRWPVKWFTFFNWSGAWEYFLPRVFTPEEWFDYQYEHEGHTMVYNGITE